MTELDVRGRVTWTLRVGPDAAATGPLIGNDGLRWLVTLGGEVAGVSAEGRLRFRNAEEWCDAVRDHECRRSQNTSFRHGFSPDAAGLQ